MELGMHAFGEVYVTGAEGEVSRNSIVTLFPFSLCLLDSCGWLN